MSTSLKEFVAVAVQTYPDHFLEQEFGRQSELSAPEHSSSEALAAYIAGELIDLYDPDSGDAANIARISAGLERSVHLLENIVAELRRSATDE